MLNADDTVLLVTDVQGKLAQLMHNKAELFENIARLVKGANVLAVPVIWTEQNPDKLGPTIADLSVLIDSPPVPKLSFSCCGEDRFMRELEALNRRQVLICGIESHICVYQTVAGLIERGYGAHAVADAISSRTPDNREIGLHRMTDAGASITSVEMALFELLQVAAGDRFRAILQLVK